ncbi:Disease resistance protein RPM1 [Hordeum vulgare]|nr:Disease resistance protein RPM1 [Hordeum vulgare]
MPKNKLRAGKARELSYDLQVAVDELLCTLNSEGFKWLMEKIGSLSNKKLKVASVVGFGVGKTTVFKAMYDKIEMYLIVIDDIWNENIWKCIKYAFSSKNNLGSRIITTTRIVSVSEACCSSTNDYVYKMEPLSDDDSKKLLYSRIFGSVDGCPQESEQVSSDILKKCGGVPLAIISVASVLAIEPKDEWHVLLKSIGHGLTYKSWENMQMMLSLSYNYLPPHLKTCLLYLSIFFGSHVIERYRLLKKLIVEGIVTQKTKVLSPEEAASKYLDELVNRNLIHPLECNNNGEVISYHIHPILHDVLKAIAIEEKFAASLDDKDISSAQQMNLRHLSIDCPNAENLIALPRMTFDGTIHSLTIFGHANRILLMAFEGIQDLDLEGCKSIERADLEYMCSMVLLERLCLAKTQIRELPPEIGNLEHLERLDVGGTEITELPPQIGKLLHLKTLDVGGTQIAKLPPQICKLKYLEGLDVSRTQITKLPPQISKLQHLKTLVVAGTQITKLPPQIGNLIYLEGLDVGGTQITKLPPQIGKLQHLKTLDARKSGIQEIPDQVLRLTGLHHLLIGDNDSNEGVKLPDGIGKMTSLQQLWTIDLRKCSVSSLKELGELPFLKDIAVVGGDEPGCTLINNALLSSLERSTKLQSLVVYSDFRLRTLQPSSAYKYLNCRKKLTVVKSLKIPIGFAGQQFLRTLDIKVCKLDEGGLKILGEMPRLQSLIVRLEVLPTKMIPISCKGFAKLESFLVDCRMPRVIFEKGAMPKLEYLELKLYGGTASEEHMCINHLLNLQKVTLRYAKWYATNKGVRETTKAVKTECKEHQNEITLCITEEDKGGKCIPKTEIFQENRVASSSRITEIEEKEDTQDGGLHQSSCANASCSGTSEIEEVVE